MTDWHDMVVGARMTVDGEFASRVDNSQFSRQQWGLIMTATTFEIENPEDPATAQIVADTSNLEGMMSEIEKVGEMGPMGRPTDQRSGGGLFDSLLGALGLGSNGLDKASLREAETLVGEYADALQAHLESSGRWEEVRSTAAAQPTDGPADADTSGIDGDQGSTE